MSGFTGFIGHTQNPSIVLNQMLEQIRHRGHLGNRLVEGDGALGARNLHITENDRVDNENYFAMLDGTILNASRLRRTLQLLGHHFRGFSETELLIKGYEEFGEDLPNQLRGMFAFVIWDRKRKKLFAARDLFGTKPFYYAEMEGTFLFGSEIKSFMPHPHFKKELNVEALKPYLIFQFPVLSETFFKGVHKLPAAHYLVYVKGKLRVKRYGSIAFEEEDKPLETYVQEIGQVLRESIQLHKSAGEGKRVGSFLSSGIDSSYIASILKPQKTFTAGFSKENFSEIDDAAALCMDLGIQNIHQQIEADRCFDKLGDIQYLMDEPHSNPSIVPLYFLCERASQDVDIVLSGEGADELFGGYDDYKATDLLKTYQKLPVFLRRTLGKIAKSLPEIRGKHFLIKGGLPPEEWFIGRPKVFEEKELDDLLTAQYQEGPSSQEIVEPYFQEVKDKDPLTKMQFLDIHLWLVDDILLKADKMSMAHSLQVYVPFLDREVMKVAARLPVSYRVSEHQTKRALRLAALNTLPEKWANRKKIGFPVPIHHWIREEKYYIYIKSYFESEMTSQFFNREQIVRLLDDHYNGKGKNGRKVWAIFMFLVWYQRYFVHDFNWTEQKPTNFKRTDKKVTLLQPLRETVAAE